MYDYGARWYDPQIGRWISPDPIIPNPANPQSFNRFTYVLGNPLNYTDPSGYRRCAGATDCVEPPPPPAPGEDPAWDRTISYDPNFSYSAYLDGQAHYERYIANPGLYADDKRASSELASYRTDIASTYAEYGEGKSLEAIVESRLEGGLADSLYSQGDPMDLLGISNGLGGVGGGGVAASILGRFRRTSTLQVGPYAGDSIPARGPGRNFIKAERDEINRIGQTTGCHTCGTTNPGTKSKNFIPDHQPPSQLNVNDQPQRLYPHCLNCSRRQGGEVRQALIQRGR